MSYTVALRDCETAPATGTSADSYFHLLEHGAIRLTQVLLGLVSHQFPGGFRTLFSVGMILLVVAGRSWVRGVVGGFGTRALPSPLPFVLQLPPLLPPRVLVPSSLSLTSSVLRHRFLVQCWPRCSNQAFPPPGGLQEGSIAQHTIRKTLWDSKSQSYCKKIIRCLLGR